MKLSIVKIRVDEACYRKTRCHIFTVGSHPVEELMTGERFNKPYQLYRKEVVPAVLKAMNLPASTKVSWRQDCGCPCGCSPGFIIHDGETGRQVFVDVRVSR